MVSHAYWTNCCVLNLGLCTLAPKKDHFGDNWAEYFDTMPISKQ